MARGPIRITREGTIPSLDRPGPGTLDFALRSIRGGKFKFMEVAAQGIRFEPRIATVVETWQKLTPWQRRCVKLEDLAADAGLTPGEFLAAVVRAAFELTADVTDLLVACAFPDVVAASAKRARTPQGVVDRQLFFEHMDVVRTARGSERLPPDNRTSDTEKTPADRPAFLRRDHGRLIR
jgi:hypothetical protein